MSRHFLSRFIRWCFRLCNFFIPTKGRELDNNDLNSKEKTKTTKSNKICKDNFNGSVWSIFKTNLEIRELKFQKSCNTDTKHGKSVLVHCEFTTSLCLPAGLQSKNLKMCVFDHFVRVALKGLRVTCGKFLWSASIL